MCFILFNVDNKQESCFGIKSNDGVSAFVVSGRIGNSHERIEEDIHGFFESYVVFLLVCSCFLNVPHKLDASIEGGLVQCQYPDSLCLHCQYTY